MRRLLFLLLLFFSPLMAFGQGQYFPARTVTGTVNGITRPIAGATVTVCPASTGGIPCSPALANTVFQDSGLQVPLANPFTTDLNGNYPQAALAPGIYTVTESAFGYVGYSYQMTVPISTIVSFISGNLSPLFTTAVTTPTTTPTLSFTASSFAAHRWYGNNTGSTATPGAEQPACGDLSDAAASCNTNALNASNISSGTLAAARGGAGTVTGALKGNGSGTVSQAGCGDLSNAATSCSTNADIILDLSDPGQTLNTATTNVQLFTHTFTPSGSQIPNTTGGKFRVRAYGTFQVSSNATTVSFGLSINGSSTLFSIPGGPSTPGATAHTYAWWGEMECTNISSATYQCVSSFRYTDQSVGTLTSTFQSVQFSSSVAYGRTSLGLGVQFSTSSTSNSMVLNEMQTEQLN